jgi:hypothetical protein
MLIWMQTKKFKKILQIWFQEKMSSSPTAIDVKIHSRITCNRSIIKESKVEPSKNRQEKTSQDFMKQMMVNN